MIFEGIGNHFIFWRRPKNAVLISPEEFLRRLPSPDDLKPVEFLG